jgi:hypothetical protein
VPIAPATPQTCTSAGSSAELPCVCRCGMLLKNYEVMNTLKIVLNGLPGSVCSLGIYAVEFLNLMVKHNHTEFQYVTTFETS